MPKQTVTERLTHETRLFAGHIASIMTQTVKPEHTRDRPLRVSYSVGPAEDALYVTVLFWHRGPDFGEDPVWDQTMIIYPDPTKRGVNRSEDTGNRCGAREAYARLFAEYIAKRLK